VNLMVAGERYTLAEGEVLAFPGNLPHAYQNDDAPRAGAWGVGGGVREGRRLSQR